MTNEKYSNQKEKIDQIASAIAKARVKYLVTIFQFKKENISKSRYIFVQNFLKYKKYSTNLIMSLIKGVFKKGSKIHAWTFF